MSDEPQVEEVSSPHLINCEFSDGPQSLLASMTPSMARGITKEAGEKPDGILTIPARVTRDGPEYNRVIRGSRIKSIEKADDYAISAWDQKAQRDMEAGD